MTQELINTGIPELTASDVDKIASHRDEPRWLRDRRAEAWRAYDAMDLPDPGDEEWRRTNLREMTFAPARALSASVPIAGPQQLPASVRDAWSGDALSGRLVQHDSDAVFTELAGDLRAKGVILTDLHSAVRDYAALIQERLYSMVKPDEWKFLALNAALWSGGCFLYVPKGVELELPVQLLTAVTSDALAVFPRVVVVAERHSRLTFIDESVSPDADAERFVSSAVEIFVGEGAHVEYYDVNRWGKNTNNFKTVRAVLGRDARFTALAAGIGSKLTKMRIDTEMPEAGAQAQLLGVTFGDGRQHFDYNTLQDHGGAHTISDLQFKSALTDSASLVWYGITRINETAGGSEANQTSRNLLLSEHAKASPIPILEIKAHDVSKCSHGATVGPVEEEELFYLQARAIPKETAEQMLVEGFFANVVDRIPNDDLRVRVMSAVLAKAGGTTETLTYDEIMSA